MITVHSNIKRAMHYKIYHVMIYMTNRVIGALYIESICTYMYYIIYDVYIRTWPIIRYISAKAYIGSIKYVYQSCSHMSTLTKLH